MALSPLHIHLLFVGPIQSLFFVFFVSEFFFSYLKINTLVAAGHVRGPPPF